ncbi:hypothetical protein [Chiayiivirga flava]|uniref:Uncharacterized protein n=1 Tax=Chiayiivirga flava TaxID=659595 RepID=A0A7W8G0J6_9GAMM|nr:hypothetical protein [Chiayiivirga flava]MBB5209256.1 hypothetical protein [Chiayiivirga flava]
MHTRSPCLLALLALSCALSAPASAAALPACPNFLDGLEIVPVGTLTGGAGAPIQFVTHGNYTVKLDRHTVTITDPLGRNTIQHWGDPHENLNGKHIKDWNGAQRTLLLGDDTRITLEASGPHGVVVLTSIYDGRHNVQIDNATNTIVHTSTSLADTLCHERTQHDGETARFSTDAQTGIAVYRQVYVEDAAFQTTPDDQMLGTTGGFENPNQVNDYYDDPRLGHT